jgi:multiple sugar transport system permease protein
MEQEMKNTMLDENVTTPETNSAPIAEVSFNVEKERKKQKAQEILKNVFVYLFLTVCAALAFLPFFWMFVTSLKDERAYRDPTSAFFPDRIMWENYKVVFNQTNSGVNFTQILTNTLVVGVLF